MIANQRLNAVLVLVLVLVLALAALTLSLAAPAPKAQAAIPASTWTGEPPALRGIHVKHPPSGDPYLADAAGRQVLLRGVATNALIQYPSDYQEQLPVGPPDFAEMAALGFTLLRLPVSWSQIMPSPGQLNTAYLAQVRQLVIEAGQEGLAVLVDLHQDRYNRHIWPGQEVDGAPDWATLTGGVPCVPLLVSTACAQVAEQQFWDNASVAGAGLQTWYLRTLVALGRAVRGLPNLAGLELMNEPTQGALPPGSFEQTELFPFYTRMISGLRTAQITMPLWFEPSVLRDSTDSALVGAMRFSSDRQLVYAVHIYTDVFSPPFNPKDSQAHLQASFLSAAAEARIYGTPWVDDEFGADASPAWDGWLARELALQNQFLVGSSFWIWKQQPHFYNWQTVELNGSLRHSSERAQLLSLPHVEAVAGQLLATTSSASTLTATARGPGGRAVLWSGTQVISGGTSLLTAPLLQVRIDGQLVPAQSQRVSFTAPGLAVVGYLVTVTLPPGHHEIVLQR